MAYDIHLLCELYLLSLKIFIFVSFKNKQINLIKKKEKESKEKWGNVRGPI